MKTKTILYLHIFISLLIVTSLYLYIPIPSVHATSSAKVATPTATPTKADKQEIKDEQLNDFKTRVASRVAQLKLTEKRGVIGKVSAVNDTTRITISDIHGDTRIVDVDELTKFSSPSAKESFGISDIEKGATIGILGLYNKQTQRIFARFINVVTPFTTVHGHITNIDRKNFAITVATEDNKKILVDIENATKTNTYTKESAVEKLGFSKVEEGQRVIVTGYPVLNEKNHVSASRVLIFPEAPKNPKITVPDINTSPTP